MRSGETPVPIPNTMVKTWTADGTALETVWESRWPPDYKKTEKISKWWKIETEVLVSHDWEIGQWIEEDANLKSKALSVMALHANAWKKQLCFGKQAFHRRIVFQAPASLCTLKIAYRNKSILK